MSQLPNGCSFTLRVAFAFGLLLACGAAGGGENDPAARFRGTGKADFIRISNVTCKPSSAEGVGAIAFDLAWDHSWRAGWEVGEDQHGGTGPMKVENWDAAWVFVKLRKPGADHWTQATLSKDRTHHAVPAGATLDVGLNDDGKRGLGVFIYRDGPGSGANNWKGVSLRWMHAADGVPDLVKVGVANDKLAVWLNGAVTAPDSGPAAPSVGGATDLSGGAPAEDTELAADGGVNSLLHGDDAVEIQVHAIQMVYVPQGAFWAGDGAVPGGEGNRFWAGPTNEWEWSGLGKEEGVVAGQFSAGDSTAPFRIESEKVLKVGGEPTHVLNNRDAIGMYAIDDFNIDSTFTLPAEFPKGYAAFYCMRYEVMQGQYVAFLNTISAAQQAACTAGNPSAGAGSFLYALEERFRNQISISASAGVRPAEYQTTAPFVACNWLQGSDGAAYAAWAGLRPMTDLEFEKACRGPCKPVPNECAWGTDRIAGKEPDGGGYTIRSPNKPEEAAGWAGKPSPFDSAQGSPEAMRGNAFWSGTFKSAGEEDRGGPLRAGIFAAPASSRITAGASYWGIMDMSGNLTEVVVAVGTPTGRRFAGTHGDGTPPQPSRWQFLSDGTNLVVTGLGSRGGSWASSIQSLRTSSRRNAALAVTKRGKDSGFRAVRTAP